MMEFKEWSKLWYDPQLGLESYQAVCIKHGFPSHMHDYYVFCYIEKGLQSFLYRKAKYLTPPGGLILLNPGDAHTGEPADVRGFEYRAVYPTVRHLQEAVYELSGKWRDAPFFPEVRVDDPGLAGAMRALHQSLAAETPPLQRESLFLMVLTRVIRQYAASNHALPTPGREPNAVKRACQYIHDHAAEGITLTEVAESVHLSRYYFLRVFHEAVGMPPHAYLESVRIGKARRLLEKGLPLNQVAHESGFSDQSHFTNRFKRLIGVTPGQYAHEFRS
jgi:AraC-like DNA-binding protein